MADPAAGTPPGGAPEIDDAILDDPASPETTPRSFDQEYVSKVRRAGAHYRTKNRELQEELEKAKPYADIFEGYEPEATEAWRNFLTAARSDPASALAVLIRDGYALDREGATEFLNSIYEAEGQKPPEPAGPEGSPEDKPLTRSELERELQARDARGEQARVVELVKAEARDLGFKSDAPVGSLDEFRYQRLLYLAHNKFGNDLTKASEALVAEEQALVEASINSKKRDAQRFPVPTGGEAAGPVDLPAGDWAARKSAAGEFLRAHIRSDH